MENNLLKAHQDFKIHVPMWRSLCFVAFCVWQMGFVYFAGPSLTIDGRTPLPISIDNITLLIIVAYVLSIAVMCLFPKWVVSLSRVSCLGALVTVILLFIPFSAEILELLIYAQCFFCCFMIGFESATIIYFFNEESTVRHLLVAYPIGYVAICIVQNDWIKIDYSVFRIITLVLVALLTVFYFSMPARVCPPFVTRQNKMIMPKRFLFGVFLFSFVGALLGAIGPAAAAEIPHGVVVFYFGCAVFALTIYVIYKVTSLRPLNLVSYLAGVALLGYLLFFISHFVPQLALVSCFFMGAGMTVCSVIPLIGLLAAKDYPSRFISPIIISLAMVAVFVQSTMLEAFRSYPMLLNLCYLSIVVVLVFLFVLVEPYLIYSMKRRFVSDNEPEANKTENDEQIPSSDDLKTLTNRELEVVNLIATGYSNSDIAKMLFISEHTVKDHCKNIYRKLEIRGRYELMAKINKK